MSDARESPRDAPFAELHAFPDGDRPHTGNPAALMLLEAFPPDADLLGMARSSNLSETAFLVPLAPDRWHLRWFTPGGEVELCGHATMASAVWLFRGGHVAGAAARFETLSGELVVSREGERFAMDFPAVRAEASDDYGDVLRALGVESRGTYRIPRIHGTRYALVEVREAAEVAALRPDLGALRAMETNVVVTAPGKDVDFVSRFFAPASGVDEDPVTGSAHCTLAPFWAERLGRQRLRARQIGPRPGALEVEVRGDRVLLRGTARPFVEGRVRLG